MLEETQVLESNTLIEEEERYHVTEIQKKTSLLGSVTSLLQDAYFHWSQRLYQSVVQKKDSIAYYENILSNATSYEQWASAATILDQFTGKEKWKNEVASPHYDYELVQTKLEQLKRARKSGDLSMIIFLLRTSLSRSIGDIGKPMLYGYTHIGTKKLIDNYIDEVVKTLNMVCDTECEDVSTKIKYEFFTNTRQSFGRTALMLSGGASFGLNHVGVLKCLYEHKLLPRIISGASSGSIIAAIICTHTEEEFLKMLNPSGINLNTFARPGDDNSYFKRFSRFLKHGVLFDVDVLIEMLRENIGDYTFLEAYNRTRRILNIPVSSSTVFEMPRLLNYLTAPDVIIWSAVAASCAVPCIYKSAPLLAKDKAGNTVPWAPTGHRCIDGSVENDLPMKRLSELFNVNHFIVCQVNPHVIPFMHRSLTPSPARRFVNWVLNLACSEIQHRMNQLYELGIMRSLFYRLEAIMSQRYSGDITIVPDIKYAEFINVIENPTPQTFLDAILRGERAIWPSILFERLFNSHQSMYPY
ncbi:Lipase 5, variant 2 [Basidiobolus ranarum]|uniref:Lipase 5, variant 2 n=1 Tax=Basidiobolus ranarum TaxID=34480 RepID=A0ABR2W7F3_9FUNG